MKPLFLLSLLFTSFSILKADDIVTLSNCQQYSGKVLTFNKSSLSLRIQKKIYDIPTSEIYSVKLENASDSILKQNPNDESSMCMQGTLDAQAYHGKVAEHVALGCLCGAFGVLGSALSQPSPEKDPQTLEMVKNKSKFNDPTYLKCYRRKALTSNVLNALLGWGIFIAIYIPFALSQQK